MKSNNRVLIVASEFPPGPGGIGTHAYQLAQHLNLAGNWETQVVTLQDYSTAEAVLDFNRSQRFKVTQFIHAKNLISEVQGRWVLLIKIIKEWHPDILVVTGDRQVWLVAVLQVYMKLFAPANAVPWCSVWHGVIPPHPIARRISAWAFSQPDLVISVSQYSLQQLLKMGARLRRSLVITNGADEYNYSPDPFAGAEYRKILKLEDAVILLTVGHVTERKGQDIVIKALPEILKSMPNVHYLIAGLPTRQAPLEELAAACGVKNHVHFAGRVNAESLNMVYNACDIFVLTSRHSSNGEFEGYGIVAVEAALCSKPSVVAGNSGLAEAVQDGQTGFVVPENDSHAAALAICKLAQDAALRNSMGLQARRRALDEQTWSACMDQYNEALTRLLNS